MPRKPTEKVIEHRITLGTYERQVLSDAVTSYNFKNVATPVVSALSDTSFLLFIGGILGLFLDRALGFGWREATEFLGVSEIQDWLEIQNLAGAAVGGVVGIAGGPFGIIIGSVLGSVAVEGAEELASEFVGVAQDNPQAVSAVTSIMLRTYWAIEKLGA